MYPSPLLSSKIPRASWCDLKSRVSVARIPRSTGSDGHSPRQAAWGPAAEIFENATQFIVDIELPGINPNFVEVNIQDMMVIVQGPSLPHLEMTSDREWSCRGYGPFTRLIALPVPVRQDEVKICHDNGIMTLFLSKMNPSTPKPIKIVFEN